MPLGIGGQELSGLVDGGFLADAGDDVLQLAPLRHVIEHVIDRDQRHACARGDIGRASRAAAHRRRDTASIRPARPSEREAFSFRRSSKRMSVSASISRRRHDNEIEAFDKLQQIRQAEQAFALLRAALAERQQPRQPAPGGAVFRISQNVGRDAVVEHQPRADRDAKPARLLQLRIVLQRARGNVDAHHARDGIPIGNAEPAQARARRPAAQAPPAATRRAGRRNCWSPPVRHTQPCTQLTQTDHAETSADVWSPGHKDRRDTARRASRACFRPGNNPA